METKDGLLDRMNYGSLKDTFGTPLTLFPDDYHPPPRETMDVHQSIRLSMHHNWTDSLSLKIIAAVTEYTETSVQVQEIAETYRLTLDECAAITYYTVDARRFGGACTNSPYYVLNHCLAKRHTEALQQWKPYLFYLLSGLSKLPTYTGCVFRALDKPITKLSRQYQPRSRITWVSFTSTSINRDVSLSFSDKTQGTWMRIEVVDGRDIAVLSLFPSESEVLLLPNATFVVEEYMTAAMKSVVGLADGIDALVMKQLPTPTHLQLMLISTTLPIPPLISETTITAVEATTATTASTSTASTASTETASTSTSTSTASTSTSTASTATISTSTTASTETTSITSTKTAETATALTATTATASTASIASTALTATATATATATTATASTRTPSAATTASTATTATIAAIAATTTATTTATTAATTAATTTATATATATTATKTKNTNSTYSVQTKAKVVMLGDTSTGKTSLLQRYMFDTFESPYQPTIGIDFLSKTVPIGTSSIRMQLWDTAGQERFRSLLSSYIRDSSAAIVCYDIANRQTFNNITRWMDAALAERGNDVILVLCGNKADLENKREVSYEEGFEMACKLNVMFIETSAKSGMNVKSLFKKIAMELVENDAWDDSITTGGVESIQLQSEGGNDKDIVVGCRC